MHVTLVPLRQLLCAVALLAAVGRADAQLLEVEPFIAYDATIDLTFGNYSVGTSSDSSMVAVTSQWGRDNDKQEAIARHFSASGVPLGPVIRLDDTTDVSTPQVFPDTRGGYIVIWKRNIGLPLIGRFLAATGQPTSPPFTIAPSSVFLTGVAGLPSGSVIGWSQGTDLRARRYDLAGQPNGAVFDVAALPANAVFALAVADKGDGGFVIAWPEDDRIRGRLYDAAGTPLGPVTELVDDFTLSAVVTNPLGGFVVVGKRQEDTHARRSGVWARRFDDSGAALGPSFVVELLDPEIIVSPRAAIDPVGRLFVAWGVNSATVFPRGRAFDPAGRPLHPSFRVAEDTSSSVLLAARPDGLFLEGHHVRDVITRDLELQVRALCVPPHHTSCGDGVIEAPCERCDNGPANSDTTADACRTTCATATCGDGVIDHNEACDDGNLLGCDGCDSECNVELGFVCGDGVVSADCDEECDDGGANDDTLPDACRTDCRQAHCGDDVLDTGEACDDGNVTSCDGCSDLCVGEPGLVCGDGIPEVLCGEQCDDGNPIVGDGCAGSCRLERVPGGGSPKTDCLTEWVVDNPTNVPRYDKNGAISGVQVCADNDAGCDFDGGIPGSCTFHMRVCANNTGLSECEAGSRLQSWQLRSPSAAKAAKKPPLAAVRAAFSPVPGAVLGPPLPDVCSGTLEVPVALRANASGIKAGSLVLKSYATRYTGERDADKIKLICTP